MCVHIFGAVSSPGCVNYGMKYLDREHERDYPLAASFIHKNFYVDDGLISVDSVQKSKTIGHSSTRDLRKRQVAASQICVQQKRGLGSHTRLRACYQWQRCKSESL